MTDHLDQLDLVLAAQIACLTALKNWQPRKVELVKSNRRDDLEAFTRREEEQVARMQQAESQRLVLVSLIAHDLGLTGIVSLSSLLPHVPSAYAERLAERGNQLATLVAQIREGQDLANQLLRVSLEYVHFTMDVFAQLANAAPPTGYGQRGDVEMASSASWLVNRKA